MISPKCDGCALHNFAGAARCRRCGQPLIRQARLPRAATVRQPQPSLIHGAPYAALLHRSGANYSWRAWHSRTSSRLKEARNQSRRPKHLQVFGSTVILLAIMLFISGVPPEPANVRLSLISFHFAIFLSALTAWSRWLMTRRPNGRAPYYSRQIEGALTLPVSGLIVQALVSLWSGFECWSKAREMRAAPGPMLQETSRRLRHLEEFFASAAQNSFWVSVLFAAAVVFLYLRFKRSPIICVLAVLIGVLLNIVVNTDPRAAAAMGAGPPRENLRGWEFAVAIAGAACALINLAAFICYFAVSKRVNATYV